MTATADLHSDDTAATPTHRTPQALAWLAEDARERVRVGLHRDPLTRSSDNDLLNLSTNDYLGLSTHPAVCAGAVEAVQLWGTGATASRLVSGTTQLHIDLEDELADFVGCEAGLVFSSGYLANVGAITALVGRGDLIVSDAGAHASLIDGCRLSRARVVVVERGDHTAVRAALSERTERRALVVTDSIYSIDGEPAPIAEFYRAATDHGAAMLVDEAHALGVRGPCGRGVVAEAGLAGAPDLVITTVLSKSLGAQGGVVLASPDVRTHLIDRARTFIFDTGLAPAAAGAALAALRTLRAEPDLVRRVRTNAEALAARVGAPMPSAAVISLVIGDPHQAVAAAAHCRAAGVLVGCFRPPSVPAGTSRLRLTVRADLEAADLERAAAAISDALSAVGAR